MFSWLTIVVTRDVDFPVLGSTFPPLPHFDGAAWLAGVRMISHGTRK